MGRDDRSKTQLIHKLRKRKKNKEYENNELKTLLNISSGLYKAKTFEDVGRTVVDNLYAFKLKRYIGVKIAVYDSDVDEYSIVFQTADKLRVAMKIASQINQIHPLNEVKYYSGLAIKRKKTLLIQDNHSKISLKIDPRQKELPESSMIFIPLYYNENLVGLISFSRTPKNSMDKDFVGFLDVIAKNVSMALGKLLNKKRRKRAEEELRRREQEFKALADNAPDIITRIDKNFKYVYINSTGEKVTGIPQNKFIGKNSHELGFPKNLALLWDETLKRVFDTRNGYLIEFDMMTKTGLKYFEARVVPEYSKDGKVEFALMITRDVTDRKRVLEKFKRALDIFFAGPVTVFRWSPEPKGKIDYVSQNVCQFGYESDDFIKGEINYYDIVFYEDRDWISDELKKNEESRNDHFEIEYRIVRADNEVIWVHDFTRIVRNRKKEIIYRDGYIFDITKRKKNEKENRILAHAIKNIGECISITDLNDNIIFVNEVFLKTYGYSEEELIGRNITIVRAENNSPEKIQEIIPATLHGDWSGELLNKRKDGSIFPIYLSTSVVHDEKNEPFALIGIALDITERKHVENALRDSEEKYRSVVEQIMDGIYITDMDTKCVIESNIAFHTLLGYSCDEINEISIYDFQIEERNVIDSKIEKILMDKDPIIEEIKLKQKDGNFIDVFSSTSLIVFKGKEVLCSIVRNITERKIMMEELEKAQKLESIATVAGGMVHNFNNIIQGIIGNVTIAQLKTKSSDESYKYIEKAMEALPQIQELTKLLLMYAKGAKPLKRISSVSRLLKEIINLLTDNPDIIIEYLNQNESWIAEFDEAQMRQAIINIIMNAKQSMPRGGKILIRSEYSYESPIQGILTNRKYIKISIKDNGTGIPKENFKRIFEPFFTTALPQRKGLGLSIAYSILKRHGGYMTLDSEVGTGTTFYIFLPAVEKEVKTAYEKSMLSKKESEFLLHQANEMHSNFIGLQSIKGKILLQDNEDMILKINSELLKSLGYITDCATDSATTINMYKNAFSMNEPYDLVLLDIATPGGMEEKATINKLKEINPKVKAIVSSAYGEDPLMFEYNKFGFIAALSKPYTSKQIQKIISEVLNKQ